MDEIKKITILHLEDESSIVELVGMRLKGAGIQADIVPARNKKEFFSQSPCHSYDVVLLDYQLPDFDGISALRMIRQWDQDTPVIMVSGELDEELIITSLRLGATDYVLKNNMERLAPAISRALEERARKVAHQQTLAVLQDTQTRLSDLAVNLPGGLFQFLRRTDGSFAIPWCSDGFEKILGVSAQLIKDDAGPVFDQIDGEDLAGLIQSAEHSATHLQKWDQVCRLKTISGPQRWVHAISQPRPLEGGNIIWNGLLLEVSAQKRQEEELAQYRDHLQELVDDRTEIVKQQAQIIDQIHDAVVSLDTKGQVTSWNKGAERIFGYSRDEILGQPMSIICPKSGNEITCKEIHNVIQNQSTLETEIRLQRKNGKRFTGYLTLSPLRESTGEIIGIIAYAMDISKIKHAESALQNSEARYRAVVETAVDGIITIDERGTIETFNHAAENMFGYPAAEVIGNNVTMLMPQSYAVHHQQHLDTYLHNGTTHVIGVQREVSGLRKDGTVFPMQLAVSEVRIDGKRKFTGMARNITQLKQAKEALLTSERFSRNILNSLSDHIAVLDKNGLILQVNDAWEEYAQTNGAEARGVSIGCNYLDVCQRAAIHPMDFASRASDGIKAVLDQQRLMFTMEYPCHSTQRQQWFLMRVVPLLGEAGGAVVAHMNITDRVLTEHALQESERRLKEAQHIGRIGNWRWLTSTEQLDWSEETYRIYGRDPCNFQPTHQQVLSLIHPGDVQRVKDSKQKVMHEGKAHSIDHRIIMPDGGIRWVHEEAVAVLDEFGNPVSLTGTVQDITERKEIENQLIIAKNEAEQASRAKSEFLSSMSHELRTPLNAILGYSQLMLMDELFNQDQLKSIDEINKAGQHLLQIISDLLDLAKIEAGRMPINLENLPLWEIIEECHQLVLPTAHRRNITISCGECDEWINAPVHADRVRLKQVILNIVSNAVKYNRDNGKVSIKVEPAGEYQRLSVTDTGKGIPEHHMAKLFSAFNRLGAESSNIEGTGIGLVIAKSLTELMGGVIKVESTPNQGTTFWIDIPTADLSSQREDQPHKTSSKVDDDTPVGNSLYTILYIEDNPSNLRLVELVLKRRPNIKLLSAAAGPEGIEIAQREKPDLVLLDINLPGMDGYEVLANLQNNELTRHISVIALSANAMKRDIERGMQAGFIHYITKPVDVNQLLSVVDESMNLKQGAA